MRSGSRRWALVLSMVASAALVAGVVTVTVAGSREPAAALHLMFGDAWLSNGRTGTASHVNGYTGITDARARVGSAGDPFQVVERQDGAYVLDLKTGRLLGLSSSSLGVSASRAQHADGPGLQVATGGGVTWVLDRSSGLVSRVNPTTLAPLGAQIPLGARTGSAIVDSSGALWVPVPSTGEVMSITPAGATSTHQAGKAGDPVEVAALATGVWAVDTHIAQAVHLAGSGPARLRLPPVPSSPAPTVAAEASSPTLVILAAGTLLDVNTASASASSYAGPAAAAPAQVVMSGSQAYVLHPGQATVDRFGLDPLSALPSLPVSPGSDQLISKDNLVFVNATNGPQAVAVDPSGHVTNITKYQPPRAPTASATPSALVVAAPQTSARSVLAPPPTRTGPPRHGVIPAGPPTTPALAPLRARRQPPTSIAPAAPPPAPPTYPSTTSTTTRVAPAAPGVPQSVSASADASGTLHVTWRAPASDGGSAITGYLVVVTPGNGGAARTLNASATAPLQARTAGLTIGVKYCAQVRAVNAVGAGPTSPSGQVCATPQQDEPGAPGNVQAVESAAGQVTVTWTAASTGPFHTPVSTYTVEGGPSPVTVTSGLSTILSGLQAGTQYQFSVIATNANRHQSPAGIAAPLITWSPPGTPTNLTLVAGNSTVTVTFSPPSSDGGSPVTGYNVTVNGTAYTQQGSGGTYSATAYQTDTVTVTAVNAVGSGQAISQGVTPFTRAPTYICMSDTNGFEFISSEASCEATATNHVSLAGPGPFQWVTAGPGPGAVPLYRTYVGDSEQWQVGSPAAGSVDGISAYVWTSAYPGATEVCEARTSDPLDPQGWYDMLYVYGTQPGACIATFWV